MWIQLLGIPLDFGVACIHRLAVFIEAQNISRRVDDVCFSKAAGVPAVRAPDSCSLLLDLDLDMDVSLGDVFVRGPALG